MKKLLEAVVQISIGVIVGSTACDVMNKVIVPKAVKVLKSKKGET